MSLFRKQVAASQGDAPATRLAWLMSEGRDQLDAGQLVRALARSVVHVPMPEEGPQKLPRLMSDGEVPLYCIEDDDGVHALLYSSARRLVQAWGAITAASATFVTLAAAWPDDADIVIDAGLPDALEVPRPLVEQAIAEVAGIPTATSVSPSLHGNVVRLPDPEIAQIIGSTREFAPSVPELRALWRAETLPNEPSPRPLLMLLAWFDAVDDERLHEVMTGLSAAASAGDPRPIGLLAAVADRAQAHAELAQSIRELDGPYWSR